MSRSLELTVDLSAIAANWRTLNHRASASQNGAVAGAVVKADAYGLGMAPVAKHLQHEGCAHFFVATVAEGAELRAALGAASCIWVLQGVPPGGESRCVQHNLRPVLISQEMVKRWHDLVAVTGPKACAIKVNTGMNRLGLQPEELKRSLRAHPRLWQQPGTLLMSHLACADEPAHALNASQLETFQVLLAEARARYPQLKASFANSSGIFLGQDFMFDIARPGAALYGISPTPSEPNPVQPVAAWHLPILQLRQVPAGECVGYGAETQLQRASVLACVAGGYADGILRSAFPKLRGWVAGHYVPLVGRVSMDTLVFDVTEASTIERETAIEILGPHCTVDNLAEAAGTIGYEVLTSIGSRVSRRYKQAAASPGGGGV